MGITKTERADLRTLIRLRFKVLRADVMARQAELLEDLHQGVTLRFAEQDAAWSGAVFLIEEAAREANRKANDALRALSDEVFPTRVDHEYEIVVARPIVRPTQARRALLGEGKARIEAGVRQALLRLDRDEAGLLTDLASDALESDAAKVFLGRIPTMSELVPVERLLQLEQALRDDDPH